MAVLLLGAAGCGLESSGDQDTQGTSEAPPSTGAADEEVQASVDALLDESFRFSGSIETEIEPVESSAVVESFVTQQSGSIAFDGEYEGTGRFAVEIADGPTLTFYDGSVFATTSGGSAEILDADDRERQALADLPALLEASAERGAFEEVGIEEVAGRQARRYSGTTDGTAVRDAYARAASFAQVPPPDEVLAVEGARADFYVDEATGDLLRQTEETTVVLDFGELGLGADGVARLVLTQERDFSAHGDRVIVERP